MENIKIDPLTHVYIKDEVIQLKSISNEHGLNIGETYKGRKTTSNNYYFIDKLQLILPSELFVK